MTGEKETKEGTENKETKKMTGEKETKEGTENTEKTKMGKFQQGDVIMRVVKSIPDGAKQMRATGRGYVLAKGEATGHSHVIEAEEGVSLFGDGTDLFLSLDQSTEVKHEEHGIVTLPKGKYKIGIVREVDPFEQEIRSVKD